MHARVAPSRAQTGPGTKRSARDAAVQQPPHHSIPLMPSCGRSGADEAAAAIADRFLFRATAREKMLRGVVGAGVWVRTGVVVLTKGCASDALARHSIPAHLQASHHA